jgi:hypothetical protein
VTASGIGAILLSIAMALGTHTSRLPGQLRFAAFVFGGALIVLGLSRWYSLSLLMMLLIGGGYVVTLAGTQTLLQTWVSDALRGRVMSFYSLVFLGIPPFGSLFAGWLADRIGAPRTVLLGGIVCALATLAYRVAKEGDSSDAEGLAQEAVH